MSVNAAQPRIIVFPRVGADLKRPDAMTAVGFVRGEPFVEVVSRDPGRAISTSICSASSAVRLRRPGCDLASVLTEEIEHDWTAYSVYDHDDLEATSFDCIRAINRRAGHEAILRMQELSSPWLHWFPQRFVAADRLGSILLAAVHGHARRRQAVRRHSRSRRSPAPSTKAAARSSKPWCARRASATSPIPSTRRS
jgi:hypothetical protein